MSALVEANGLTKKYKDVVAVDNLSFALDQGKILGILGPNGAGKSSLLNIISTLIKPEKGELRFRGSDAIKDPKSLRLFLGVVPQEIALYGTLSVEENLDFWGGIYGLESKVLKQRIGEVLEMIGLSGVSKKKVNTISGGMKRRVNIAAALVHNPELVIMDEPTVGIDIQSRKYILEAIKKLKDRGSSVIFTSHYLDELEMLSDKIMIMDHGRKIAEGSVEQLQKLGGMDEAGKEVGLSKAYLNILSRKQSGD